MSGIIGEGAVPLPDRFAKTRFTTKGRIVPTNPQSTNGNYGEFITGTNPKCGQMYSGGHRSKSDDPFGAGCDTCPGQGTESFKMAATSSTSGLPAVSVSLVF